MIAALKKAGEDEKIHARLARIEAPRKEYFNMARSALLGDAWKAHLKAFGYDPDIPENWPKAFANISQHAGDADIRRLAHEVEAIAHSPPGAIFLVPPAEIEIRVCHASQNAECKLSVPVTAKFVELKEALVAHWQTVGKSASAASIRLLAAAGGRRFADNEEIGAVREVFADDGGTASEEVSSEQQTWCRGVGADVYFHRERLCTTHDGRRVDMITISADVPGGIDSTPHAKTFVEVLPVSLRSACVSVTGKDPARFFGNGRRIVFISARVHPGETPGQFAFFGFLEFILSDDARAKLLRQFFIFKLVPMLNPDGVARGHTRANANGLDLNRCYASPTPQEHEGIFWVLEWLVHWASEGRLLFYLDMHAHAHTRGCVVYGNQLSGVAQAWNIAFAHVCQLNAPHFDVDGCEFPPKPLPGAQEESGHSGRAGVGMACHLFHAYTLECHYSIGRKTRPVGEPRGLGDRPVHPGVGVKSDDQVPFGVLEWESIGEAIAVSILDMHGSGEFSRPAIDLQVILSDVAKNLFLSPNEVYGHYTIVHPDSVGPVQEKLVHHDDGPGEKAQLWRVVHDTVVARDGPSVDQAAVDLYAKGCLISIAERVDSSSWVRIAAPDGYLGGKLNNCIANGAKQAFMLTDGREKGLGTLLEPANMSVRIPRSLPEGVVRTRNTLALVPSQKAVAALKRL
eukprot:gnl/TRDRNA2_/TRDRNA2_130159_c2_seq2.p1 gnl/TRDRNA2_/TRDRNA2_130159_c2~~gnl/TRDRNA2_/TRDRNA2_130159_c2_seq2.p1  ORF type:complete len:767 (+),score=128.90 gnl/TRDRNA2_/TRDRNA2_130159_c2_seq2:247-2301(+)